ncbi:hypothetical protein [Bacillus sp. SG-1]|uniref:hypothetical protein n=1 Tax=Bacillus sp. SG-1 TaxID=161544 RepID=UPI00015436A7|nr:hypothetical protein [Bacillus sp. SG-1]EDL65549.1 hypothetical protein BSG1_00585 [Bacillus sp. SG-1]
MANIVLTQYIILTWLFSVFVYYLPKKILFIEAAFVFMVQAILLRNHYSILGLNLEYIQLPNKKDLFIAFILYRSFMLPIFFILLLNITLMTNKKIVKSAILTTGAVLLLLLEWMSHKAELVGYNNWNLLLQTCTNLLLVASTFISYQLIRRLMKRVIV